ncbi:hypothetical protein X742_31480 [Mesorhizobium sp. LNHC232B00]|nr:hypothetical protein X742_31480 [Mesorhizobium sp. LNHC232B00]
MNEYFLLPLASLPFPNIDPILIQIGPLAVHWYGVGYIVGILFPWWYAKRLAANPKLWPDGLLAGIWAMATAKPVTQAEPQAT